MAGQINCCPALCALKWHVVLYGQVDALAKASKAYSEWEHCVLFLALGVEQGPKKAMHAELSKWLPGRSAEGLRQAYAHNIAGQEAKFMTKLRANNWPSDNAALLAAWPGPSTQAQAMLDALSPDRHKAVAAAVLQELSAWAPLAKKQKVTQPTAAQPSASTVVTEPMSSQQFVRLGSLSVAGSRLWHPAGSALMQQSQQQQQQQQQQRPLSLQQPFQPGQQPHWASKQQSKPHADATGVLGAALPLLECDLAAQIAADLARADTSPFHNAGCSSSSSSVPAADAGITHTTAECAIASTAATAAAAPAADSNIACQQLMLMPHLARSGNTRSSPDIAVRGVSDHHVPGAGLHANESSDLELLLHAAADAAAESHVQQHLQQQQQCGHVPAAPTASGTGFLPGMRTSLAASHPPQPVPGLHTAPAQMQPQPQPSLSAVAVLLQQVLEQQQMMWRELTGFRQDLQDVLWCLQHLQQAAQHVAPN